MYDFKKSSVLVELVFKKGRLSELVMIFPIDQWYGARASRRTGLVFYVGSGEWRDVFLFLALFFEDIFLFFHCQSTYGIVVHSDGAERVVLLFFEAD